MNHGQRFVTLYRREGSKPSSRKRNAKRQNGCLGGLTNSREKKRSKKETRKGKIYPLRKGQEVTSQSWPCSLQKIKQL